MYVYNGKSWLDFKFFFSKADTLRRFWPYLLSIFAYSILVAFLEINYLKLSVVEELKNINLLHSILGFVISLLIVFRTNTAYDRWWEGRKVWGELTNTSRNLAIKLSSFLNGQDKDNRTFFKKYIPLYAETLRQHLNEESTRLILDEVAHPELFEANKGKHLPNQVAKILYMKVAQLHKEGLIGDAALINLNKDLTNFTDICGKCERIKNTPIPYSYSSFIKRFITIYILTMPIGYVFQLGYNVAPLTTLGTLELIAEDIEDPFGNDPNDLPMDKMAENINRHVREIL
jgi:putative membrane protein